MLIAAEPCHKLIETMRTRWHCSPPTFLFLFLLTCAVGATPWPLGVLTTNSLTDRSCPSGFNCHGFSVSCPGVSNSIQGFGQSRRIKEQREGSCCFSPA